MKKYRFLSSLVLAGVLTTNVVGMSLATDTTKSLGVYNDLIKEGEVVAPFLLKDANDSLTIEKLEASLGGTTEIEDKTTIVKTGDKETLRKGETTEEYTVVIYGDVNKDGYVDVSDVRATAEIAAGENNQAKSVENEAADVVNDDYVDVSDVKRIAQFAALAPLDESEDLLNPGLQQGPEVVGVHTVSFVDNNFDNPTEQIETDENGKISSPKDLRDKTDTDGKKWLFLGWTFDPAAKYNSKLIHFETEVFDTNKNVYAVWKEEVSATVILHYDGLTDKNGDKLKVEKPGYLAGDIISSDNFDLNDEYSGSNGAKSFRHSGWYVKSGDSEVNKILKNYEIPFPTESDEETANSVTVDLYPVWDISVASVGDSVNASSLSDVIDELTTLHNEDEGYCGTIDVESKLTINSELKVPDGITVNFKDDVTVDENNILLDFAFEKADEDVTITKIVDNTNVADTNKGLNASLNNKNYDIVQIKDNMYDFQDNVNIKEGTNITLDLNNQSIQPGASNTFEISAGGSLTIIDSSEIGNGKFTYRKALENKGTLTIGSKDDEKDNLTIVNAASYNVNTIENKEGATLIINSGKIENPNANATSAVSAVKNESGANLEINGGSIDVTGATSKAAALLNEGNATISGGEISRSKANATTNTNYVVINHGTMKIKDGKITEGEIGEDGGTTNLYGYSALITNGYYTSDEAIGKEECTLEIYGGEFNGGKYIIKNDYAGNATIIGGKYTAKPATHELTEVSANNAETRSIFKTIGEMTLDFTKATKEDTLINLGNNNSKTALVLIGDQKITNKQSMKDKYVKNSITVYPFSPDLVQKNEKAISDDENAEDILKQLIVVEKGKEKTDYEKSYIEVHVGYEGLDPKVAGQELMTLIKNYIAKQMQGIDALRNTVKIVLDSDVEIEAGQDTEAGYGPTTSNTILDLNGNTLTIHNLYVFKKNVTVEQKNGGKILLNKDSQNTTIWENGSYAMSDEELEKLAGAEQVIGE